MVRYNLAFVALLICTTARAEPPMESPSAIKNLSIGTQEPIVINSTASKIKEDIDSGVVINQVVTVAGQDFYEYFVEAWRDMDGSEKYSLAIHEMPSARWGSEIWIEYEQRKVFRIYLPPSRAAIKPISIQAVDTTFNAVQKADVQRRLVFDADLAHDEF